ncbi:MAG: hypothetical protein ACO1NX_10385 [Chitinophagaceae bacterium]
MQINKWHSTSIIPSRHIELDMSDCYTCSFAEFYPFCNALFYFSTFKAFDAGLKA